MPGLIPGKARQKPVFDDSRMIDSNMCLDYCASFTGIAGKAMVPTIHSRSIIMKHTIATGLVIASCLLCICVPVFAEGYRDGIYTKTVSEQDYGTLTIRATIQDGRLSAIDFPEGTENLEFLDGEMEEFLKSLMESPMFMDVDAISGATPSCDLIKAALFETLKDAQD